MAKTDHYYTQFEPNVFYHVYNRSVAKTPIFRDDDNYRYFLKQYAAYLSPVLETWSYALLGNHFHFGVKIKSAADLAAFQNLTYPDKPHRDAHKLVSHQFQRFFQSYAMAFNKQQNRIGTLFQTPFKRCAVDPDSIQRLILYHHINPQHHRMTADFQTYPWTSYIRYLNDEPSLLPKTEVLELFNGKTGFRAYHDSAKMELTNEGFVIEET